MTLFTLQINMKKKTLVLGASTNPEKYAYKAVVKLLSNQHDVVAVGLKEGKIATVDIKTGFPLEEGVDTVTLYVSRANQPVFYDYILKLHPKRIIFNPGTENEEFKKLARENDIQTIEACTLVMLATGEY